MIKKLKVERGFTLIELMIVVAVIGILAAVAYPAYQDSMRKSRRADAQGALMGLGQAMERYFTEKGTYKGAAAGGADTGAPAIYPVKSPIDGSSKYYDLAISAAGTSSYTVTATPAGAQANDKCGTLSLTSTGATGVSKATVDECWRK